MSYSGIKRLLYTYTFFDAFILIYPLYAVMFADKGLSAGQISSLFVVWSVTSFLLEVPSGAVADRYSRKYVLLAGLGFKIAAFAVWVLMPNYIGFLLGFLLWGIENALVSGTHEALVYDELKRFQATKDYAKVTGRLESLDLLATILAGLAAATLADAGYRPVLLCSIAAVGLAAVALSFLPKARAVESTHETKYFAYLREGVQLVFKNKRILALIVFGSIITGLAAVDEYYGLLLKEKSFTLPEIAFWGGAIYIGGIVGSLFAYKLETKKISYALLLALWASILFATTLSPGSPSLIGPVLLSLFVGLFYLLQVLLNSYLQHHIPDKTRATTTSVGGLFAELGALIVFGAFALSGETQSYTFGFQVLAGIIAVITVLYVLLGRHYHFKG